MKTMTVPMILLVLAAISGAIALVNGAGGIRKLIKGQKINKKNALVSFVALFLAIATVVPSMALWPKPAQADEVPIRNQSGGLDISLDPIEESEEEVIEVHMSGDRTNRQLVEFLKAGFGSDYTAIWNGNTADEFMFANDQDKIKANEAYLKSLGLDETGFRNGVCPPTDILTAEVIKSLDSMTDEEREEVFDQHRWQDIYRRIITNPGFCDMVVQDLEEYPEYVEQNSRWLPALKELLAKAKASPDGIYSLLVVEDDGTEHYSDEYRYNAARVCASLENAIIRGVAMNLQSIMNWELPSLSPEIADRWTVKLTEKEDQENKPATIWAFPNVKSGNDAYTDGFNLADLRAEKFAPEDVTPSTTPSNVPPTPTTPTTPVPIVHQVGSYFRLEGTSTDIVSPTYQPVAEKANWTASAKDLGSEYVYVSNSFGTPNGVVTGTMGTTDVTVIFYYRKTTKIIQPNVELTVQYVHSRTGSVIETATTSHAKGTEQSVSKKDLSGYAYLGYYTVNGGSRVYANGGTVTLNSNTVVKFFYDDEYKLTTRHLEKGTGKEVYKSNYSYHVPDSQYTATGYDDTDTYRRVGNSENSSNPKTLTGKMPNANKTVTFYYEKVGSAQYTVSAYYRAVDSNHNIINPIRQPKKTGDSYTTDRKKFDGYHFSHVTGDPTSGTVKDKDIEVTYWYELDYQDGNGNKDPQADPTQNGTGNANPVKGPDDTTELEAWQPNDPDTGERVPEQQGNEPTANHLPTDNPGGQAAGSEERQEVSDKTVSAIIPDDQETESSGTGGRDPAHVDTGTDEGVQEVEGGGYEPPAKEEIVPDNPPAASDPVIGENEILAEPV